MRTTRLQAGAIDELRAGNLLTIDLGFAEQARSSAWAMDDRDPECGTFAMLRDAEACGLTVSGVDLTSGAINPALQYPRNP